MKLDFNNSDNLLEDWRIFQWYILSYCQNNSTRLMHLEYLLVDPAVCYLYAYSIIKGRFELAEIAISQSSELSWYYAKNVLNSRFELAEPIIKNSRYWKEYKQYFNIKD